LLYLVGALGPAGARYADHLERVMLGLRAWETLGAATSHWEITGDNRIGGAALAGIVADLVTGRRAGVVDLSALERIAEMGYADPTLVGVLYFLVRAETRPTGPSGAWQNIDLDGRLAETANSILEA
jgi:hypothetical protein